MISAGCRDGTIFAHVEQDFKRPPDSTPKSSLGRLQARYASVTVVIGSETASAEQSFPPETSLHDPADEAIVHHCHASSRTLMTNPCLTRLFGRRDFRHSFGIEPSPAADPLVFITAFAPGEKGGIHAYEFDTKDGQTSSRSTAPAASRTRSSWRLSPDRKFLYSIHAKQFGGKENEQVAAYQVVGRTGELKLLNRQSAEGTAACYLDVDKTGKTVLVANYASGSVASLPVKADGSLGEPASFFQHKGSSVNPPAAEGAARPLHRRQPGQPVRLRGRPRDWTRSSATSSTRPPAKLTPNKPPFAKSPAGAGPRHLTFHPNGKRVYVINELLNSVTVFDYDANAGTLTEKQTISTLPADFKGTSYCAT